MWLVLLYRVLWGQSLLANRVAGMYPVDTQMLLLLKIVDRNCL